MPVKRLGAAIILMLMATGMASALDRFMAYHDTTLCMNDEALQPGVTAYPVKDWLRMQRKPKILEEGSWVLAAT